MLRARILRWAGSALHAWAHRIERRNAPIKTIAAYRNRRLLP